MGDPLLSPVTKRYADRSARKSFGFSFYCDQCGKEFRSETQAFHTDGMVAPVDLRVVRMLWSDQHRAAYERANLEAIYTFYYCPSCGRRVCMECFCESETDSAAICKDCRSGSRGRKQGLG